MKFAVNAAVARGSLLISHSFPGRCNGEEVGGSREISGVSSAKAKQKQQPASETSRRARETRDASRVSLPSTVGTDTYPRVSYL